MPKRSQHTNPDAASTRIFVVEDNLSDVLLIQEAVNTNGIEAKLQVIVEGEKALNELSAMAPSQVPNLIVVDLNLPRVSGLELLRAIRKNRKFDATPVIILTSSKSPEDRVQAETLGASAYITKPMGLDEFLETVGGTIRRLLTNRAAEARLCVRLAERSTHRPRAILRPRSRQYADPPVDSKRAARRA